MVIRIVTALILIMFLATNAYAKLGNKLSENSRQYGLELISKQFSDSNKHFSGKKVYQLPMFGWRLEVLYSDGESFSETARPKGDKVTKKILSEKEANVIADILYPKRDRGPYRKQVKNANFVSHFFEYGVISYEMQLDRRRKNHIGVTGVRTVLYSNKDKFKNIKINAYH